MLLIYKIAKIVLKTYTYLLSNQVIFLLGQIASLPLTNYGSINYLRVVCYYYLLKKMQDEERPSPFFSICFYAVVDIAFWIFVTLYMVGDMDH